MTLHRAYLDVIGGDSYTPAMMEFDGSTGYYDKTHTASGNVYTGVVRFKAAEFSGGAGHVLVHSMGNSLRPRIQLFLFPNDHADATRNNKLSLNVQNSAGTVICWLFSNTELVDDNVHTVFYSFDGDTGAATFIVDGVDEDDTGHGSRVAPTTGTLDSGAASEFGVGAFATGTNFTAADIGFVGYREAYLTNYTDFMDGADPLELDESGWTEWGAQPLFWNEHGDMENNLGSAGNMTRNGTVVVGKGGN